jgi:hypothetical protein
MSNIYDATTKTHLLGGVIDMGTHNEGVCAKECFCQRREGKLNNSVAYLCGPIDDADDDGVGWRRTLTEELNDCFGVKVLDPTDKPFKKDDGESYEEIGAEKVNTMTLKKEGRYEELADKMRKIVRTDLRMVDLSDFIITYLPRNVVLCGTIHEIVTATESKKPTLIVVEGGRKYAPNWLWGMLPTTPHTEGQSGWLFDSFEDLNDYLYQVHEGIDPAPKSSRWVFMDLESRR